MQVWVAKISGIPTPGDSVHLHWAATRGGLTSAGHIVCEGDTIEMIRDGIVESAKNYLLSGEQEVKARGSDSVMAMTTRTDGVFTTEVRGEQTEKFTIEVL